MKLTYALALLGASANAIKVPEVSLDDLGQSLTPQVEYPGDNCCYLYEWAGFKGLREKVCHEGTRREFWIMNETGDDTWNDRMSSYYCGKNVWYNMCRHGPNDCTGVYNVNSGAGHHMNYDLGAFIVNASQNIGFDDEMSYMMMGPYEPSEVGAINLFQFKGCTGKVTRVYWNPNDPVGGRYNGEDLRALGVSMNDITSIMLPKGYYAALYNTDDFVNELAGYQGRYINDFTQEMECIELSDWDADNQLNSLKIVKSDSLIGQWQAITSTESQEYKFHVGINESHSEGSMSEIQDTLTKAAEMGISWKIFSASAKVSHELASTLMTDMQSTYGVDYGIENTTNCTAEGKEGAGMYQWVLSTRDAKYQTFTWHTVCRTGADFNTPPACPYGACLDAECKECDDWEM